MKLFGLKMSFFLLQGPISVPVRREKEREARLLVDQIMSAASNLKLHLRQLFIKVK